KAIFGALYGLGVFGLYALLSALGAPTFYDKLLCVPLLNLSVIGIDRFVQSVRPHGFWSRWRENWQRLGTNPVHMLAWITFFLAMTALGKTDGKHTGDSLPFWTQSCQQNKNNACQRLLQLESTYCNDNSAWACNELGAHYSEGIIVAADAARALTYFSKACELRLQASCISVLHTQTVNRMEPRAFDLRLLLREGGKNLMDMSEPDLYARACDHGWSFACNNKKVSAR
ncbi:MAG: hypothetical protein H7Y02_14325, partial [Candidatus Obscuribacterales bacterium]|nr:hypothetical protein [Steroidobacteraceae bacterium]